MSADEVKEAGGCGCGSGGCCGGKGRQGGVVRTARFIAFLIVVVAAAFLVVKGLAQQ
jgi:hypothetical protein